MKKGAKYVKKTERMTNAIMKLYRYIKREGPVSKGQIRRALNCTDSYIKCIIDCATYIVPGLYEDDAESPVVYGINMEIMQALQEKKRGGTGHNGDRPRASACIGENTLHHSGEDVNTYPEYRGLTC